MNIKEFMNQLIQRLREVGYEERGSKFTPKFYYGNDYSAINMQYHAEQFDIEGDKLWIRIPCQNRKYEDIFMELYIMGYSNIHFHSNPDVDINTITVDLLFINSNKDCGWHTVVVGELNTNELKQTKNRYIEHLKHTNSSDYYFEPTEELIDYIIDTIEKAEKWLNDIDNNAKGYELIQSAKSTNTKRKAFTDNLKDSFEKAFVGYKC